jgi:hypothetical protein
MFAGSRPTSIGATIVSIISFVAGATAGLAVMDGFTVLGGIPTDLVVRPFQPASPIAARLLVPQDRPSSRHAEAFVRALESVILDEVTADVSRWRTLGR